MLPRMNKPPSPFNPHRIARLIAWLQAMLAWAASVLFTDVAQSRRRIRQRYGFLSLDPLARLVRDLAIVRAADLMHLRARPRFRGVRNAAAHGFRRCTTRGAWRRAIAGSRLRNALKHRDPLQRIQRLLAAIADIDAFARRYLARAPGAASRGSFPSSCLRRRPRRSSRLPRPSRTPPTPPSVPRAFQASAPPVQKRTRGRDPWALSATRSVCVPTGKCVPPAPVTTVIFPPDLEAPMEEPGTSRSAPEARRAG